MQTKRELLILIIIVSIFSLFTTAPAFAQEDRPVVYGVLFYSPTCPHCETVINEVLPPLVAEYGSLLVIHGVDTSTQQGSDLYDAAVQAFSIPPENQGVPTMIIGDRVMVGSRQIPEQLPALIEEGTAAGGIPWPEIPGLSAVVDAPASNNQEQTATPDAEDDPQNVTIEFERTWIDKFQSDLAANILSVIALVVMIAAVALILINFSHIPDQHPAENLFWLTPLLALIGLGIAGYLAYVEMTQTDAICGPVGRCNTVQQSPYATLFGILPVGLLGFLGYIGVILTWLLVQYGPRKWKRYTATTLWVFLAAGTAFSIYLTFLEPFVIGASCMWCLSSALIMTVLLWLNTQPMKKTWRIEKPVSES